MMWILPIINAIAVVSTISTTVYWLIICHVKRRAMRLMPELAYPEGELPIIGHSLELATQCSSSTLLWEKIAEFCDYYKIGFQGTVGHQVWIIMPDPDIIQEILSSQDAVEKSYVYRKLNVITDGVFIASGIRWRKLRKRLNFTFNGKHLDCYFDAVNKHTEIFLNVIGKRIQQMNKCVDIHPYISRCFFDIMTKTHFNSDTEEQINNEYEVTEKTSQALELLIEKRLLKPHLHIDFLFQFTQLYAQIGEIKQSPYQLLNGLIEKRMKTHVDNKDKIYSDKSEQLVYTDLVAETLRELNMPSSVLDVQRSSSDLLIAGSDTTSVTSATLLYHLAVNKDLQDKVYDEVSKLYGTDSFRPLTRQDLNSLTYLDMAIKEALRWSSPPGIVREPMKDVDVGKYVIPKNSNIYIMMIAQHWNPAYYERVNEFYPEHFTTEAVKSRPKMGFFPFSSGPRNCPGYQFAYILLKAITAVIINNFIVETDLPSDQVKRKMILMTQHVQGYPIKFIPRNHKTPRG